MQGSHRHGLSRVLGFVFLTLLLLGLPACGRDESEQKSAATAAASQTPAVMVQAQKPDVGDVPVYVDYVGRLAAKENVEIRARVEGYLKERLFTEGSLVKKGDLLFVIEPRQYQENLQKAKAELSRQQALLAKAKVDFTRFETLYKQGAVSRDEYDTRLTNQKELTANADSAKAAVEAAERDMGYTRIIAPINGRIGKALVHAGNLVGKGDNTLLAEISSTDPMHVDFSISERDYLELSKALRAEGNTDKDFPLTLVLADDSVYPETGQADMAERAVDAKTGTLGIRGVFPNPDGLLKPGQFAKIRALVADRKNALLVPQRALVDIQGTKSVYVVGPGNVIEARAVTIGGSRKSEAIIDSGLTAQDMVVTEGVGKVRPGTVVKVAPAQPVTPAPQAPKS